MVELFKCLSVPYHILDEWDSFVKQCFLSLSTTELGVREKCLVRTKIPKNFDHAAKISIVYVCCGHTLTSCVEALFHGTCTLIYKRCVTESSSVHTSFVTSITKALFFTKCSNLSPGSYTLLRPQRRRRFVRR